MYKSKYLALRHNLKGGKFFKYVKDYKRSYL